MQLTTFGDNRRIFVCHAHLSKGAIAPILRDLLDSGYQFIVDKPGSFEEAEFRDYILNGSLSGISGRGGDWTKAFDSAIESCSVFMPILSDKYIEEFFESEYCYKELRIAVKFFRPIMPIFVGNGQFIENRLNDNINMWGTITNSQWAEVHDEGRHTQVQIHLIKETLDGLLPHPGVKAPNQRSILANGAGPDQGVEAEAGWLRWVDFREGLTPGRVQPKPWPITLGAAVGLDRGRQVALCNGLDAAVALKELDAVEAGIAALGEKQIVPARNWTSFNVTDGSTESANIVWQVHTTAGRDMIEGVLLQHFGAWNRTHGASAVLILPTEDEAQISHIGEHLSRSLKTRDQSLSISCFLPWDSDLAERSLTKLQKDDLEYVLSADRISLSADALPGSTPHRVAQSTLIQRWIDGRINDEEFFAEATIDDVRLAAIAGRLGGPINHYFNLKDDRARALLGAARDRPSLRISLPSLQITPTLLLSLADQPVTLRAVFGFVSAQEASETPPPWAFEPIEDMRHGRSLIVSS